jgi:hypothetical protein
MSKLRQLIRESINEYIKAIDEAGHEAGMKARMEATQEAINKRKKMTELAGLDEDVQKMIDERKVKEVNSEVKALEKSLAKLQKQFDKLKSKGNKSEESEESEVEEKEIVDEVAIDENKGMNESSDLEKLNFIRQALKNQGYNLPKEIMDDMAENAASGDLFDTMYSSIDTEQDAINLVDEYISAVIDNGGLLALDSNYMLPSNTSSIEDFRMGGYEVNVDLDENEGMEYEGMKENESDEMYYVDVIKANTMDEETAYNWLLSQGADNIDNIIDIAFPTMNESFLHMQKLAGVISETEFKAKLEEVAKKKLQQD